MSIILVSLGVFLCFFGLTGFAVVIYFGFQARKQIKINGKVSKKTIFEQLIIINYLAICLSAFGLIIVILGMLLS
jgi:hypothetical protein